MQRTKISLAIKEKSLLIKGLEELFLKGDGVFFITRLQLENHYLKELELDVLIISSKKVISNLKIISDKSICIDNIEKIILRDYSAFILSKFFISGSKKGKILLFISKKKKLEKIKEKLPSDLFLMIDEIYLKKKLLIINKEEYKF